MDCQGEMGWIPWPKSETSVSVHLTLAECACLAALLDVSSISPYRHHIQNIVRKLLLALGDEVAAV